MWLTTVSIRRPIFIIMFVLALIVLGWTARSKMPVELEPKIDFPYITVLTTYPGAGPNEIETLVSEPIEKAVGSISNLRNVTSSSQDGVSSVVLEFELGTPLDAAAADVRDKVSSIRANLPEDVEEPTIMKLDIASEPVMTIGLIGPISPKEMRILADDTITDRLAKVGGVAAVNVTGGEEREISVQVDRDRLDAYGLSLDKIVSGLRYANLNLPAGSIKEGARDYSVRTVGEFHAADEIRDIRIELPDKESGKTQSVRLGDIATVSDSVAEPTQLSRINGKPSVVLNIQKQSDANTVSVADGIKKQLKQLESIMPAGVQTVITRDDSKYVKDSLNDVQHSLFEGVLLVVIIVFLFLHTARATFIVAIAIPTSIVATHLPISSFGFTLNTMVLLALSLVVGILVDDSIVVLENIERHLRMRKHPEAAAIDGRSEIGLAAITITFVDIVVFVPIAFMGGIVGMFFKQFGITVAVATAFSLFMSFTLTPMLASRWLKSELDKEADDEAKQVRLQNGTASIKDRIDNQAGKLFSGLERFLTGLNYRYKGVLEWALHNRYLTLVIGFVSLLVVFSMAIPLPKAGMPHDVAGKMMMPRLMVALIALLLTGIALAVDRTGRRVAVVFGALMVLIALTVYLPFGFGFFPEVDRGEFTINVRTAPGTSLRQTDQIVKRIEAILATVPEFKPVKTGNEIDRGYYMSYVGMAQSGFAGANTGPQYAVISGKLVQKNHRHRGVREISSWLGQQTAHIPGAEMISVVPMSGHGSGGLTKEVQGQNMDNILDTANRLAGIMKKIPGAVDVDVSYKPSKPERRIVVDRLRAADLGLSVAQIATAARTAIDGDDTVKFREGGTEYPIRVQYAKNMRSAASDVEKMIVATKSGAPVYLRDVADVKHDFAPTKIDRKNRQRVVYVTANVAEGYELGNVSQSLEPAIKSMQKAPGTTISTGGMEQIMYESFGYMGSSLLLAVLLVYMLMGALFESFLTPFVIMFSLPQAMVGALLALLITGKPLSIVAMIGIIMLMGLVTKNAILLIDYTNTLRSRGEDRHTALLEAGPTRLRPILMTTLAMIGGMLPTAVALSEGSEMRSPMAIAVIGGLILSTLLTLIVIPVTYTVVDDAWQWFTRVFGIKSRGYAARDLLEQEMEPVQAGTESEV
jgi:HAE1 family hydrophobic/amphiphilic exporter-1